MFRGSTNGSSSSDDEIHSGVRGDHGYVTQTELVGMRHFLRDNLGRYERRLQTQENNFNDRMHAQEANMERMTETINNLVRQRASSRSSRTRSTSR